MLYLDTHCVAWLHAGMQDLFTEQGRERIEHDELLISPIVVLELQYLYEIERLKVSAATIVEYLKTVIDLRVCRITFERVVVESVSQHWTRDPFDRMIVAQSIAGGADLLTRDKQMRSHYPRAIW
jgi:PIN domain nuclease of toxin-antitoxin system